MKRQIRKGVFETNSSSMHAIAIMKEDELDTLPVDVATNKVITKFGEFGFGRSIHTDAVTKLSYLVTMLVEIHSSCCSMEELCQLEDFRLINDAVVKYCHCDGILIDEKLTKSPYCDEEWILNDHEGWIDHASYEGYESVTEFLAEVKCTAEEFIFYKKVKLVVKDDSFLYHDEDAVAIYDDWMWKQECPDAEEGKCMAKKCENCDRCWS